MLLHPTPHNCVQCFEINWLLGVGPPIGHGTGINGRLYARGAAYRHPRLSGPIRGREAG